MRNQRRGLARALLFVEGCEAAYRRRGGFGAQGKVMENMDASPFYADDPPKIQTGAHEHREVVDFPHLCERSAVLDSANRRYP